MNTLLFRFIFGVLGSALILASVWFFSQQNKLPPLSDTERAALYEAGGKLHDEGRYQDAIDIYLSILERNPTDLRAHTQIGHTYRYWQKYEDAETYFLKARDLDPLNANTWRELGKLYRNMNELEKSEAALLKSLEIDPRDESTYSYGLGYLYLQQKRFDEAERMFKKAIEINPQSDLGISGLGDLYREMGRYEESETYFTRILAINPKSEALLGLGWLYIRTERYTEALVTIERFLATIREKGEVYFALGVAHEGAGDLIAAEKAFQRAVELNPDNQGFANTLARVRARIDEM